MFKKLFQSLKGSAKEGSSSTAAEPVSYKDLTITPTPISEGGTYRTAGSISNNQQQETSFIRADNHNSLDAAIEHSVTKAKQIIDERGAALFNTDRC